MEPRYKQSIAMAKQALRDAQNSLTQEISTYPTPISGCDAQFNHLLAERQKVANALRNLGTEVFIPTPRIPNQGDRVESR